jgi:hypothetical protein
MSVIELYESLNIGLERAGERWRALCPFHVEKTPSFVVYQDASFYCFGCGIGGPYSSLRKKLGFDSGEKEKVFHISDDIEEIEIVDFSSIKEKMENILYSKLQDKEYEIKNEVWSKFDSLWLDIAFMKDGITISYIDILLKIRAEQKKIYKSF